MKNTTFLLILIIIFSSFLRIFLLDRIPNGFYIDEATMGYEAYSILLTGKDHRGNFLPFYPEGLGAGYNPVFVYSLIPFIYFFGLTEFAVRLTAAFYGILTVIVTYFLVKELFNEKVAILSSFFLAISPWHLQFSRIGFEVITLNFFIVLGLYFFIKGIKNKKYLPIGFILLALSTYCYPTGKLFSFLLFFGFIFIYRKELFKNRKIFFFSIFMFAIILLPMFYFTFFGIGLERFNDISIFNEGLTNYFKEDILKSYIPFFKPKSLQNFPNPILKYSYIFVNNYLKQISLDFLFLKGDINERHNVVGIKQIDIFKLPLVLFDKNYSNIFEERESFGQLYLFEIPLILYGLYLFIKQRKNEQKLILFWVIIFPIPVSLTIERIPHAIRSLVALPTFQIISAYAIYNLLTYTKSKKLWIKQIAAIFLVIISFIAVINIIIYFYDYYIVYPLISPYLFQYGFRDIIEFTELVKNNYQKIYFGNGDLFSDIFILFYTKSDPFLYQKNGLASTKYETCNIQDCYKFTENNLYIIRPNDLSVFPVKIVKTIYYPDDKVSFYAVEVIGA